MFLRTFTALPWPKWLGLLALAVQVLLPLSVATQIAASGAHHAHASISTTRHVHAAASAAAYAPARSHIHPASPATPSHSDHEDGACALCIGLQALSAFTQPADLALPLPSASERRTGLADAAASVHGDSPASYRSRAPPMMA